MFSIDTNLYPISRKSLMFIHGKTERFEELFKTHLITMNPIPNHNLGSTASFRRRKLNRKPQRDTKNLFLNKGFMGFQTKSSFRTKQNFIKKGNLTMNDFILRNSRT